MARPAFLFLVCPDAELLGREVDGRTAAAGEAFARRVYWGDEPLPESFWQDLSMQSLFGGGKAVVLRRAEALGAEAWDSLDRALKGVGSNVWPFLCLEVAWDKKGPALPAAVAKRAAYKFAADRGWVWQSPGLTAKTLPAFVRDWAAAQGFVADGPSLQALALALPEDARAARLELDKVALAVGPDKTLRREHAALVAPHGEMEFFTFLDLVSKGGDVKAVWGKVLESQSEGEALLFPLLGFLAKEARTYGMLLSGEADKLKIHPYVKQLKTPLAVRLGREGVARLLDLALDAELCVKSGRRKADQALEYLVARLLELYGSGRGR